MNDILSPNNTQFFKDSLYALHSLISLIDAHLLMFPLPLQKDSFLGSE